ncbi:MAG: DUF2169 domain-containing protein [Planctomycetes bacterium]|nr:DUF2169 domain-containing protein [Planctomycetota bacterium]
MNVLNDSGLTVGWVVGKVPPCALSATLLVKGTFDLKPGAPAVAAPKQDLLSGERHDNDDPAKPVRYPSDFAWFKPRADALLVGTCHQPGGRPNVVCTAGFALGSWSKRLAVVGDRVRTYRFYVFPADSEPVPFRAMKLSYAFSYGGPSYPKNPFGKGDEFGKTGRVLPNILDYDRLHADPESRPDPAGFGPIPFVWPQRMHKAGTYGKAWKKKHWPGLPEDADWTLFNAAPPDQQFYAYLRGDEKILLENLHPSIRAYESRLPGLRARWFVTDAAGFREVPLHLDTLWIDADAERLVLVWRGVTPIANAKMKGVIDHFVLADPLAAPRSPDACAARRAEILEERRKAAEARPAPPAFAPVRTPERPPMDWVKDVEARVEQMKKEMGEYEAKIEEQKGQFQQIQKSHGLPPRPIEAPAQLPTMDDIHARILSLYDTLKANRPDLAAQFPPPARADLEFQPPPPPEFKMPAMPDPPPPPPPRTPWTRESVQAHAAKSGGFQGQDLRGLDLSGLELEGLAFAQAVLSSANLKGARLGKADLTAADLAAADLTGIDLSGAKADAADFGGAKMAGAKLARVSARRASFFGADLGGADAREADFSAADFQEAGLAGTDFRKAVLHGAQAGKAKGAGALFEEADLTKFAANRGADFSKANLRGVRAAQSVWSDAKLDAADLFGAVLTRANFVGASLAKAVLSKADLRFARFDEANLAGASLPKANLFRANFVGAKLDGADLRASNLYEAEFRDATHEDASFQDADLTGTKLD